MEENISGIYSIKNILNNKRYIGQTINLEKRKICHFHNLKNNSHFNYKLQKDFNEYGENNFLFEILVYCEPSGLTEYEQSFVNFYKSNIYNILLDCVNSQQGIKISEETRKKMRISHLGKNNPRYGKHLSEETREKISNKKSKENNPMFGKTGKNHPRFGKHHSDETKEKMSNIKLGENNPMFGKNHSEETKKKMSENHSDFSGENHPNFGKHYSKKPKDK